MNVFNFDIILSETLPFVGVYALYALIICFIIQCLEYRNEQSQLGFSGILTGNGAVFFTALIIFTVTMIGYWYGLRIFGSEIIFAWLTALVLFGSVLGISILMQNVTGLVLKSPAGYAISSAFFMCLPLIIAAVFMTMLSSADFRH